MPRSRRLPWAAAALASIAVGCAHCDTCDDFPLPCSGGNCGVSTLPVGPTVITSPVVSAYPAETVISQPVDSTAKPPAPTSSTSPFSNQPPGATGGSSNPTEPAPLSLPSTSVPSSPPGPTAPQ